MKISRIFLWTLLVLVGVGIAAQLIWTYTGSGQWEALPEKNGVRVFSFKAPGTAVEKFKGIFKAKATVGAFVKFIQDPGVCEDVGCHDARIIEQVGSKLQYQTFQYDYPLPFKTREFVVRQAFSRNPDTRAVLVDLSAEPGKIAPNDCCTRVTEMHNTWLLTPLQNGELEVEYVIDMSEGGFFPAFLMNLVHKEIVYELPEVQAILDKDKYKNAKIDFIDETS